MIAAEIAEVKSPTAFAAFLFLPSLSKEEANQV